GWPYTNKAGHLCCASRAGPHWYPALRKTRYRPSGRREYVQEWWSLWKPGFWGKKFVKSRHYIVHAPFRAKILPELACLMMSRDHVRSTLRCRINVPCFASCKQTAHNQKL